MYKPFTFRIWGTVPNVTHTQIGFPFCFIAGCWAYAMDSMWLYHRAKNASLETAGHVLTSIYQYLFIYRSVCLSVWSCLSVHLNTWYIYMYVCNCMYIYIIWNTHVHHHIIHFYGYRLKPMGPRLGLLNMNPSYFAVDRRGFRGFALVWHMGLFDNAH